MNEISGPAVDLDQLAHDILILSRNTLLVNLRFLDAALSQLELYPSVGISIGSEGHILAYSSMFVVQSYLQNQTLPVRYYLHTILHCVFRHMYVHTLVDHDAWDLACDIAVEYSIKGLNIKAVEHQGCTEYESVFSLLEEKVGFLTAEKIYHFFIVNDDREALIREWSEVFRRDSHLLWYMSASEKESWINQSDSESSPDEKDQNHNQILETAESSYESTWKEISERIQSEMTMFSNGRFGEAGGIIQNLKEVNREKYDYSSFLKRFAIRGEVMKINDEEFDYVFYTYGLKLYENMPLVEPLEYKEVKRIKDFIIAIDTSGSVIGDLVQTFVKKTYNILKSSESFFTKINLHIIQCDTEIQEDVLITSQEDFETYMENMQLHGFGGNNEVRLFQYVDELVNQKRFSNLKGMIYFTDGYGIFPKEKPNYDVAFVFVNDRYEIPEVPPWVIKLVLQKDEI